jgi:hypothetical protein
MKTFDFTNTVTAATLNESMFKKFGVRINFDKYTREELENYRNLLRTELHQAEASSNFNDLLTHETYQKNKYVVSVLNTKIKEMLGEAKVLSEKSKTEKQARTMAAAAHDPKFAKKVGIKKDVAKEFNKKDTGTKLLSKAMKNKKNKADEGIEENNMKKLANKDYDGDGKKESPKDEVWGSRAKAAAKAGKPFTKKVKEDEKRAPAKKAERDVTLPSGAKVKATKVQGWQSQKGDKEADKERKATMKESKAVFRHHVALVNESLAQLLREDEEGKAKAITSASDMVNDFTTWMQRVGQYQTKSMIELADNIRAEFGQAEAEAFKNAVAPALAATLETLTGQREAISHAVAVLAGEATDQAAMGQEPGGEFSGDVGGEEIPGVDDGMGGDEFGGSDAAAGGAETSGREMRESREQRISRKLAEQHTLMRSLAK